MRPALFWRYWYYTAVIGPLSEGSQEMERYKKSYMCVEYVPSSMTDTEITIRSSPSIATFRACCRFGLAWFSVKRI